MYLQLLIRDKHQRSQIVILAGSREATISLATVDDNINEADATIEIYLSRCDYRVPAWGSAEEIATSSDGKYAYIVLARYVHSYPSYTKDGVKVVARENVVVPTVNVISASGGDEGQDVTFNLTATPSPTSTMSVNVALSTSGDFGIHARPRTVLISSSGTGSLTLSTVDDGVDEADGSVTLTITSGSRYIIGSQSSATANITDNDEPISMLGEGTQTDQEPLVQTQTYTFDSDLIASVQALANQSGSDHVNLWNRVLVRFGSISSDGVTGGEITLAKAKEFQTLWNTIVDAITAQEESQTTIE